VVIFPVRRFTFWAVALAVLVIVVFNVQGWLVLARTSRVLEKELGDRLQAVATTLATVLSGRYDTPGTAQLLSEVMRSNNLFNLFIVDESLAYVTSARDPERAGSTDPALEADAAEILAAFSGVATQTRLYAAGPYYLKSAFAPLADSSGAVTAVLGVEADARFFSVLTGFRNSLLLINALSLLAIAAIVLVSASLVRRALSLEQAAGRAGTMALLGQMSAAMAHDIKNPLGIIRAAAERLKKRYDPGIARQTPNSEADPTFDYIPEEVDRLDRIVTSYLSLGATRPGEPEPLNLAEVITGVLKDMEHETSRHGIAVEVKFEDLPPVQASRVELRQVFLNLVLNAIQAQPQGGAISITGSRSHKAGRDWLVIRVSDKGPGIKPEDLRHAFEPFHTTKEKGSGLGLFSVKRIVEAHKGRVAIDSAPGSGTTVEVKLPI
jgi:two-component system OmpR family sensor kinase